MFPRFHHLRTMSRASHPVGAGVLSQSILLPSSYPLVLVFFVFHLLVRGYLNILMSWLDARGFPLSLRAVFVHVLRSTVNS